jgi:putative glutamine amidotransferase
MKTLLSSGIFRLAAGIVLAAAFAGCVAPTAGKKMKKLVAIADVCKTNGFISARVTNSDAIAAAGFLPVPVPGLEDTNTVAEIMDRVDALVLTGAIRESDKGRRNEFDFMLIRMALERGLPVVGFCRGHQVINRYFGGKIARIPDGLNPKIVHKGKVSAYIKDTFHEMEVVPGSRLSRSVKSRRVTINTSHKYHVTKLGEGLKVSARSDDGVIEALEHETLPVTGFQFHPERSFRVHPEHLDMIRDALDPAAR